MNSFLNSLGKTIANILVKAASAMDTSDNQNTEHDAKAERAPYTRQDHSQQTKPSASHKANHKSAVDGLYIEENALIGIDPGLKKIIVGPQIVEIGENAFNQGTELEHVVIKGALRRVCTRAFCGLPKLKSVQFEDSVYRIDDEVFAGCTALETVKFLEGMYQLGNNVFRNCTSIKEILLADDLLTMGKAVFSGCRSLRHVHLSRALQCIPSETFEDCNSLETIDWPVERRIDGHDYPKLEPYAFRNCLCDDNWECFELNNGIMKRTLVPANQKDTVGVFDMMRPGPVAWIDRIPQRIVNRVLNHAWESSGLNAEQFNFKMEIYRVCMALINLTIIRENDDNRAERLVALRYIQLLLLKVPQLTSAFIRHVLPYAIAITFACTGCSGEGRRSHDNTLAELYNFYLYERFQTLHARTSQHNPIIENTDDVTPAHIPPKDTDISNLEEECMFGDEMENHWADPFFNLLGIGPGIPFRYDPTRYEDVLTIPEDDNRYYLFARSISSLCEHRFGITFKCPQDLSHHPQVEWFYAWSKIITDWDDAFALAVFKPSAVLSPLYPGSVYEKRLKPITTYDIHHLSITILHKSQIEAIMGLLSPYQLDDMIQVYSYALEIIS